LPELNNVRGEFVMSEAEILDKLPRAQATAVLKFINEGWEFKELEVCGEVRIHNGKSRKWVQVTGYSYPSWN